MLRRLVRGTCDRLLLAAALAYASSFAFGGTCRASGALAPLQDLLDGLGRTLDGVVAALR